MLSALLKYQRGSRVLVESMSDGRKYLVKIPNSRISSDTLAELNKRKMKLCEHLSNIKKYKNNKNVQRLLRKQNVIIEEISKKYEGEAAYSINKGERIGICLKNKKGEIEDMNTMFFVLMHELAHIMTSEYKHNKAFWDNFSLLIQNAIDVKLYEHQEYRQNKETFCGHVISHTPYSKHK
jgi:hypothetical protein